VSVTLLDRLKERARLLKRDTLALCLAARDPRTPWYAKLLAGAVVAYALSPLDLIPDFIPVLGYLDDLIIVPIGIAAALKLVPPEVLAESRARVEARTYRPVSRIGAVVVICVWLVAAAWLILALRGLFGWAWAGL
jgi:uncharacterized membrane protein YkvA (DUF1232 family)